MKKRALRLAPLMVIATVVCSGTGLTTRAMAQTGTSPSASPASNLQQPDASASGGSTLQASSPYSQPNVAAAPQNLNPAPFLTSAEGRPAAVPAQPWTPGLTSRADGTLSAPGDQPAAGTGQGIMAAPVPSSRPGKQSRPKSAPTTAPAKSKQPSRPK